MFKMMEKIPQEIVNYVKKFVSRPRLQSVMERFMGLLLDNYKRVRLVINSGEGSYTDGNMIQVSLPEIFFSESDENKAMAIKAILGHEVQHINSSNFEEYQKFMIKTGKYFKENYQIKYEHGYKLAQFLGNAIEDGRIEKILGNKLPGFIKYLKYLNYMMFNNSKTTGDEMDDMFNFILVTAKTGLPIKGFKEEYRGTGFYDLASDIRPDVIRGINARTAKDCLDVCWEIIMKLEKFLVEKFTSDDQMMQDMLNDLMQSISDQMEYDSSDEKEFNDDKSQSTHFIPEEPDNNKDDEDGDSEGDDSDEDKDPDSNGSSKSDSKEEDESKDGSGSGDSDENSDDKSDENSDDSKSDSDSGEDSDDKSDKNSDDKSDKDSKNKSKEDNSKKESKGTDKVSPVKDNIPDYDEDLIEEQLGDIIRNTHDEMKKMLSEASHTKKKNKDEIDDHLNADDTKRLEEKYKSESVKKFREVKDFPLTEKLPSEIQIEARKFKREIEKIFKNKKVLSLRGQKKGILDRTNLTRVGVGDYNVFVKNGSEVVGDYVAYVLQDGSGSMGGDKEYHSNKACAILEEGLKSIMPLKITTFCTDGYITHYQIKDFKDRDSYNYSWNYYQRRRANGGNKDGYSIRVATEELLKRPESDKILFILSDGLPSNYNGGWSEGAKDVHIAVRDARKKGITVVAIMFGDDSFIDSNINEYRVMYEKNIIAVNPAQITGMVTKVMKKILKH